MSMNTKPKKAPKHLNTRAFKLMFNPAMDQVHERAPRDRLCTKCHEIIEWKIQFGKYKRATGLSRCTICGEKNIYQTYRQACDPCADLKDACSQCLEPRDAEDNSNEPTSDQILQIMEEELQQLRERSRRTVTRKIKDDVVTWDLDDQVFIYKETGEPVENLYYKTNNEEDFEDLDGGDDEEFKDDNEDDLNDDLEINNQLDGQEKDGDLNDDIDGDEKKTKNKSNLQTKKPEKKNKTKEVGTEQIDQKQQNNKEGKEKKGQDLDNDEFEDDDGDFEDDLDKIEDCDFHETTEQIETPSETPSK